jgi:hypothetical protein
MSGDAKDAKRGGSVHASLPPGGPGFVSLDSESAAASAGAARPAQSLHGLTPLQALLRTCLYALPTWPAEVVQLVTSYCGGRTELYVGCGDRQVVVWDPVRDAQLFAWRAPSAVHALCAVPLPLTERMIATPHYRSSNAAPAGSKGRPQAVLSQLPHPAPAVGAELVPGMGGILIGSSGGGVCFASNRPAHTPLATPWIRDGPPSELPPVKGYRHAKSEAPIASLLLVPLLKHVKGQPNVKEWLLIAGTTRKGNLQRTPALTVSLSLLFFSTSSFFSCFFLFIFCFFCQCFLRIRCRVRC